MRVGIRFVAWISAPLFAGLMFVSPVLLGCSEGEGKKTAADVSEGDSSRADGSEVDATTPRPVAPEGCEVPEVAIPEACGACHGAPPDTPTHPANPMCWRCHGYVFDEKLEIVADGLHDNGEVEVAVGCSSCHGWKHGVSPPQGLDGACAHGAPRIGVHALHRRSSTPAHAVGCSNCHAVPLTTWADGHIDGDNVAEVRFSLLAVAGGAKPS